MRALPTGSVKADGAQRVHGVTITQSRQSLASGTTRPARFLRDLKVAAGSSFDLGRVLNPTGPPPPGELRRMSTPESNHMSLDHQYEHRREEFLGQHGCLKFFTNKRGQSIAQYCWPAAGGAQPRAVLHLLHGHGAYACYDYLKNQGPSTLSVYSGSWIEGLNNAGYSVVAIDLHGAGRSEGLRCYTDSFDDYVHELQTSITRVADLGLPGFPPIAPPAGAATKTNGLYANGGGGGGGVQGVNGGVQGVPRYLMGGSMGGCLATLVSMRMPEVVSGLVLLAPMLSLEKLSQRGINKYLKMLAPVMSALFPRLACVKVSKNSLYPEMQKIYDLDPNCWHGNTRARNGYEYMRVTSMLMHGGLEQVSCPFLVVHGLQDDMCDPDGSRALHARAKSTDKTLTLLDHMWHILTREPGNPGLLADIIAWLDHRTASHAPSAPSNTPMLEKLRAESAAQLDALKAARPELVAHFAKGRKAAGLD